MSMRKTALWTLVLLFCTGMLVAPALAKKAPSLDAWKPNFDPSGAKYKCIVSNVSHPVLRGVYT